MNQKELTEIFMIYFKLKKPFGLYSLFQRCKC